MKKPRKVRLDALVHEKGLAQSRARAQALIMTGNVLVNGVAVDKAGKVVDPESLITVKEKMPYVSRGGLKLAGFLDEQRLAVDGLTAIDIGSSTGGFTDCLLKRGAKKVYAVDVGKGILDARLRSDDRVVVLEERNIRHMDPSEVGEKVDLAVMDLSFISLEKVLVKVREFLKESATVLALIKPQFEVGKGQVGKGGIVRDPEKHAAVVERIKEFSAEAGYSVVAVGVSPITGAKGNIEFWIRLSV